MLTLLVQIFANLKSERMIVIAASASARTPVIYFVCIGEHVMSAVEPAIFPSKWALIR